MPPGRSTPALFELIKPVPPPHVGNAAGAKPPTPGKPVHQVPAAASAPASPAKSPPNLADPAKATDAEGAIIEPKGRSIADQDLTPERDLEDSKARTNLDAGKPAIDNGSKSPSTREADVAAAAPAIPQVAPRTEPIGDKARNLPPPPKVNDPDRQQARKENLPEETWRDRIRGSWMDEAQRLLGDRRTIVLVGTSLAIIALAGAYWLGHSNGKGQAEEQARQDITRLTNGKSPVPGGGSGPVQDPLNASPPALNDKLITKGPPGTPSRESSGTAEKTTPSVEKSGQIPETRPTPSTPPPAPGPGGDTREAGKNYLQLEGRLDQGTAERMVKFLTENGLPTIAVGVDRHDKPTNNPTSYAIFVARGVTSQEIRERAPVIEELETQAEKLGQRWKAEQKGWTTFSSKFWKKHVP